MQRVKGFFNFVMALMSNTLKTKLGSNYSQQEIEHILSILLEIGLVDNVSLNAHKKFYSNLAIDFFSINDVLIPSSDNFFHVDNNIIESLRFDGDFLGVYNYITSSLFSEDIFHNAEIKFSITSSDIRDTFELLIKHKKGTLSTFFSGYGDYIIGISSMVNVLLELNGINFVCLPITIREDDLFLFVDKISSSKIISERILKINFIDYPEIGRWRELRDSEPLPF